MVLHKWFGGGRICSVVLFVAFGFLGGSSAKAGDMVITNFSPGNGTVEVCADTKLWITFSTVPTVATSGNLQICRVSDDNVVYQLDLYSLPSPPSSAGWPAAYKITLNGKTLNYEPFSVSGKTVEIYPSTRLDYNTAYYVKMTAGFCTDANSDTSPAITDGNTWRFTTKASAPAADHEYIVSLDGSGDFCTLQGAAEAVVNNDPCRTLIKVKKGTYRELVNMPSNKINMTWLGEDRDTTIMAAYNCESFNSGSDNRMMFKCPADGFRMYNMTFHNLVPGPGDQAEVIKHSGQQCIANNCKYISHQDTLCLNGQMYLKNCYIEGDVDYIWGYGTVYFDTCRMHSVKNGSYLTQPRTVDGTNGFFFVDCNLTSPAGITGCYLGRMTGSSFYPYAQSVYINCTMPKTLILPVGWKPMAGEDLSHRRWWEYKSVEPNGTLIDVSQRLNPGSMQLDDANAVYWRDVNNVFGTWNPKALGEFPTASWQPQPADGTTDITIAHMTLIWAAGAEATSHVVYFGTANPPTSGTEQTGTSFVTETLSPGMTYYWEVDEKNSTGTTTGTVWSFTTSTALDATPPTPDPMTWAVEPNAIDTNTIIMDANTATDDSGVEYYFTNITDPNHNSGWQDSNTYTDTNLVNNKTYTYKVKARDKSVNNNETADSNQASATTPRYDCTSAPLSDLDGNCQVNFPDYARLADAWVGDPPDFNDLAQLATDWLICNRNPAGECWQ